MPIRTPDRRARIRRLAGISFKGITRRPRRPRKDRRRQQEIGTRSLCVRMGRHSANRINRTRETIRRLKRQCKGRRRLRGILIRTRDLPVKTARRPVKCLKEITHQPNREVAANRNGRRTNSPRPRLHPRVRNPDKILRSKVLRSNSHSPPGAKTTTTTTLPIRAGTAGTARTARTAMVARLAAVPAGIAESQRDLWPALMGSADIPVCRNAGFQPA